jgi:dCMP deaminase
MIRSFTWDQYFMTMAYLVSMKSKDPSTRVGAVIVGPDNEIRATGYNGLPRGFSDRNYRYEDREYKLYAINHAEENAILNCMMNGVSTKECTLYCPWISCSYCTKMIVQSGIKETVFDVNFPGNHIEYSGEWEKSMEIAKEILNETGVVVRGFNDKLIKIEGMFEGKKLPFIATSEP